MNRVGRVMRNVRCAFFVLFCLFLMVSSLAYGKESKTVRVGWYPDVYNTMSANGERGGYCYEFEQTVAGYTGWNYEYVNGKWSDLLQMLEEGDIDLMASVSYTEERAEKMLFSDLPMGEEKYYIYARVYDNGISPADIDTLDHKKVGILVGSTHGESLRRWEDLHHIQMEIVPVVNLDDSRKKLTTGAIDCVVSIENPELIKEGFSVVAHIESSPVYFVIGKNRQDLKQDIDRAMKRISYEKPFYMDELYQRYLLTVSSAVLFPEEKEWLASHGKIRVGYLKQDGSFSKIDETNGTLVGVINDYISYATHSLGHGWLNFEPIAFDSQLEEVKALQEGTIDMIFHYSKNPSVAEKRGFSLSNTVLSRNMAAVTLVDYFNELGDHKVAVDKNDLMTQRYISYNYPKWKIIPFDSSHDAERAIFTGQADCLIVDGHQISRYIKDNRLHSVFLTKPGDTVFAVERGNTLLLSILNKTIQNMPPTLLSGAISMYDNAGKKVTLSDVIKENLLVISLACLLIFSLVLLVILWFLKKSIVAEAKTKVAANHAQKLNEKLQENHEELEKALKKAEAANEAKTSFLFNMSHDIRTPMNAILGYAELIKGGLTDPTLIGYQKKMEQAGNLLLSIINHVLDMARIESGKMELVESCHHTGDVLGSVYDVFQVEAKRKNIKLQRTIHVEHTYILCDITKIQEIYTNLLSNAIKYTPSGGTVTIQTIELPCEKQGYARIQSTIADTGIGISQEFLPTIFDAFTRERNTTQGKVAGTGLGMAIVKKLVDLMGGTIEVHSQLGKGSTFTVTFDHPIADAASAKQKEESKTGQAHRASIQGKHILLAEDNDLNAEIASVLLEQMGLFVDRVPDGLSCLERIKKVPAGTYDMILMDVQMPRMDGYEATEAIRALEDKEKAKIPIIAMTANAFEEDRQMAFAKGMNGHIAKPIHVETMEETLCQILH